MVTKSQVDTKFDVTKSRLHCISKLLCQITDRKLFHVKKKKIVDCDLAQ